MTHEERMALLADARYPLAAKYDPAWLFDNKMGGQCLWLIESLARLMDLRPGMRVLDLGCGTGLTSIFLAREFGVRVFAYDLWVGATDNWRRICDSDTQDLVVPMHGDVHAMPFASGFFDAVTCVNAIQFFGTSDTFIPDCLAHFIRPDGQLGLVFWGPNKEFDGPVPEEMQKWWWPDFFYYHSLAWWRWHIEKTRLFAVEDGDDLEGDGRRVTQLWARVMDKEHGAKTEAGGYVMQWHRLVARRNSLSAEELRT